MTTHLEDAWLVARDVGDSNDQITQKVDKNNRSKASTHTASPKPLSHEDENDDGAGHPHYHTCTVTITDHLKS